MSHIVQCSCGQQLTLEQWHDGMRIRCPSCQAVLAGDPRREQAADILARAAQANPVSDGRRGCWPPDWRSAWYCSRATCSSPPADS